MMKLFIAEKPSLAKAIADGLGTAKKEQGFFSVGSNIVTWCYGHILEQYEPEDYDEKYKIRSMENLPIIPKEWKVKIKKDAAHQFNVIKELIKKQI